MKYILGVLSLLIGIIIYYLPNENNFIYSEQVVNTVTLPVEVMGPDATTESIVLITNTIATVDHIYLQVHSPTYPDYRYPDYSVQKMSLRVNGGSWVDVANSTVTCPFYENDFECVEGPLGTVRFTMNESALISQLIAGSNTIDFRFNYESGDVSSGYRVLDIDIRTAGNSTLITGTTLVQDDPTTWTPPTTNPSRIANGAALFNTKSILSDFPGGPTITASCGNCHPSNGRDLAYFAYSNHSIITRSEFHGLTTTQGEDIAAWIREINLGFNAPGRPWNPPYQPSLTIDSEPAYKWAAGGGLSAVLEKDEDMHDIMFPDYPDVSAVFNTADTLNKRQLPISFQLPDWNEWLPVHFPEDRWGSIFTTDEVWTDWVTFRGTTYNSQSAADARIASGQAINDFNGFFDNCKDFVRANKDTQIGSPNNQLRNESLLGAYQWCLVKHWEIIHTYSMEDDAPTLYPGKGEKRSWFGNARVFFNVAPHIHGQSKGTSAACTDSYFDTGWYELQVIMNAGNLTEGTGLSPVDWKYHYAHTDGLFSGCNNPQPYRYMSAWLKVVQQGAIGPPGVDEGMYLRHTTPARMYKFTSACAGRASLGCISEARKPIFAAATLNMFMSYLDIYPPSTWPRSFDLEALEPPTYIPEYPCSTSSPDGSTDYADALMCYVENWSNYFTAYPAVDAELTRLATWLDEAFPNASPTYISLVNNPDFTEPPAEIDLVFSNMTEQVWTGSGSTENTFEIITANDASFTRNLNTDAGIIYHYPFVTATDSALNMQVVSFDRKNAYFASMGLLGLAESPDDNAAKVEIEISAIAGVRLAYRSATGGNRVIPSPSAYYQYPICLSIVYDAGTVEGFVQEQCAGDYISLGTASLTLPSTATAYVGAWCRGSECEYVADTKKIIQFVD